MRNCLRSHGRRCATRASRTATCCWRTLLRRKAVPPTVRRGCVRRVCRPSRQSIGPPSHAPHPIRAAAADDSGGLAQRLARLELQLQQQQQHQGAHVFSPTALATSYRNAVGDRRVVASPAVTWFQPADPPNAVVDALRGQQLAPDAPESQVQALLERVGQLYAASQPAGCCLLLLGRSSTPTVGTRKPDLVAFLTAAGQQGAPRPVSYDALHAVAVGELTHRRAASCDGRFTAEEKGAVLRFLEDLVQEQLWRAGGGDRARVLAFLSDGVHIVFFQCTFACELAGGRPTVSLHEAQECGPFPLAGEGAALLTGLLQAPPSQLGYHLPRCVPDGGGGELALRAYLGAGATSLGFAAEGQGRAVVLKQYNAGAPGALAAAARAELDALRAAADVPGVCQLLGTARGAAGQACVLLAPLGAVTYSLRAAPSTARAAAPPPAGLWSSAYAPAATAHRVGPLLPGAAEFCDLVDSLAGLHAAGWAHRDPRPANFYRDAAGRFFVADLGSAARIGDAAAAADGRPWAFHFGPLDALLALRDGAPLPPPQPAHDFEQLARLVYAAQARDGDALPSPHPLAAAELCAWWQARDGTVVLASLLRAAGAAAGGVAEREQLKAAIRAVFPASSS